MAEMNEVKRETVVIDASIPEAIEGINGQPSTSATSPVSEAIVAQAFIDVADSTVSGSNGASNRVNGTIGPVGPNATKDDLVVGLVERGQDA